MVMEAEMETRMDLYDLTLTYKTKSFLLNELYHFPEFVG
jgi:hypothetical protein|tara:strand:+ start:199 stop:315 length:117 start_codon:yes stop_codon:yes gene_type:complete